MVAGIVLTAGSGAAGLTGLVFAYRGIWGSTTDEEETLTAVLMVGGVVGVAAGILMILIGAEQVPVGAGRAAALAPRIVLAPSGTALAWSF
jgi:hypothetical protein